ncbi:MAG: type II toxin-antitoxin system RelE/ParE family toxin [Sphingorhabdus sp.]
MIRSYRSKALKRFVEQGDASKLSVPNIRRIERIVTELDVATVPEDMNSPGLRFHGLKGKGVGRYAVDASGNWRITFGWDGDDAIDVDLEDYH